MSWTMVESSSASSSVKHPQLPPYLRPPPTSMQSASATAPSSPAPPPSSSQRHSHSHSRDHHDSSLPPPGPPPSRVHTLDLKGKLAAALGNHGKQYWNALLHFCSAKISRDEFEQQARSCLRSEDVHLHNSLVLGILYNASAAVPRPSAIRGVATSASLGDGAPADGLAAPSTASKSLLTDTMEPRKRLRLLVASLTAKERQRIKSAGKPPARSFASGASASSWAGAGADLLEKRRKEEDKRQREADRRRLCELYTEVGANDWMQEAGQAAEARRDHQAKLTNATLEALLRSERVPLCSQSKQLPDADSLGDLMTPHAVDSGLSAGITGDAAALMLAGVQAHVQNLISNLILAIRANRPAGGVHIEERGSQDSLGDVSVDSASGDADSSSVSSMSFDTTSPAHGAMLQLPDGGTAYLPSLRIHSDDGRRGTSTGSHSVASTAPSSLFETSGSTSRRHLYASTADSSMASLASTAPTSVGHNSDDDGSSSGAKRRRDASDEGDTGDTGVMDVDADSHPEHERKRRFDAGHNDSEHARAALPAALSHRRLFGSSNGDRPTQSGLRPKLGLRDAAFLFELTPHVSVEPLGVSSLERLIGADAEDATDIDVEVDASKEEQDENKPASAVDLEPEERLALAARRCAFSKAGTEGAAAVGGANALPHLATRQGYLVNQQGPLSLILDQTIERRSEREGAKEEVNATTAPPAPKRTRIKEPDPAVNVIDPVKLLAGLCD